ncbi:CD3E protein, partial [Chloroceryle aenea]|nr:CD3E protein [Chloroceryle aenea]
MRLEWSLPLLGLLLCVGKMAQKSFVMLLSLLLGPSSNKEFQVEISGTTVTITCPVSESSLTWTFSGTGVSGHDKYTLENYDSSPGNVTCSSPSQKYHMYLNARVCENCQELDAWAVTGIVAADLLITSGVLILVYYFSKARKGRASAGGRPRGQKTQRPPPVPNPDYE